MLGVFDGLLEAPTVFAPEAARGADGSCADNRGSEGRPLGAALLLSAFIPALTYYPAFALGGTFVAPSRFLPQGITNQILVWVVING